jgi:hypothetical protein
MKDAEDEAFDDIVRRQGMWGGGFQAKRAMAADKFQENVPLYVSKTAFGSWREFASDYERGFIDGMQKQAQSSVDKAVNQMAQPAQETEMLTIAYQSGYHDGKKAALAGREWNFCERCGKRTADLTVIHTCTPPQEKKT